MMPRSEAQKRADKKYFKENWKQVKLSMPKQEADALDKFCADKGFTRAGLIRKLIKEYMEQNN